MGQFITLHKSRGLASAAYVFRHLLASARRYVFFLCIFFCLALGANPGLAGDPFLRHTATVEAVQQVGPSVVNITTERQVTRRNPFSSFRGDPFFDRFFNDFFEPRTPETVQNLGSGVLIDEERHVLTNEHVINRADRIFVTLSDGRKYEANVIGADPNNDIAILKIISTDQLPWVKPGKSSDLMVGEPVIAIGNPFGLSNTVTTGVLSATNRSIRSNDQVFHGFLQTDASINPGNSGGPLLNAEGTLIGINTAIYNGAEGIGFAIPIDVAKRVVRELITHGEVSPVWFGLRVQDIDKALQEALELPTEKNGALINEVHPKSPARRAGLKRGDVLLRFDGQLVHGGRELFEIFQRVTVGQRVRIEYWRDGMRLTTHAKAAALPQGLVEELGESLLGLALQLKEGHGYQVGEIRRGSGAERIGIQAGDWILAINGRALSDAESLQQVILALRGNDRALVVVQRGRGRYHVTIPLL